LWAQHRNHASGYTVCFAFRATLSFENGPSTGYLNQCCNDRDWTGQPDPRRCHTGVPGREPLSLPGTTSFR
jgi:hypothetical protein